MEENENAKLDKMLAACEGLEVRLRIILEQVSEDPTNNELAREVRLAREMGEEILQWVTEMAAQQAAAITVTGTQFSKVKKALDGPEKNSSTKKEPGGEPASKDSHCSISMFWFCQIEGCPGPAKYCWPDTVDGQLCTRHKMKGMLPAAASTRRCEDPGCNEYAAFCFENERMARFCEQHKFNGTVTAGSEKVAAPSHSGAGERSGSGCNHAGCHECPTLVDVASKFWKQQKMQGMLDVKNKRCEHPGCSRQPYFTLDDEHRGRFCEQHKLEGGVKVVNNNEECQHAGCSEVPAFVFEGKDQGKFCSQHKLEGVVEVRQKLSKVKQTCKLGKKKRKSAKQLCVHAGCITFATYNYPTTNVVDRKPLFCPKHRSKGMVDVAARALWCEHPGCTVRANFNHQGERKGRFCGQHKVATMVNVLRSRWCERGEGCRTVPRFNFQGEKRPRFCGPHKLEGMCNVVDKTCEHAGCGKSKVFNYRGERGARFCATHKLDGMTNVVVKSRLVCVHAGCAKMAGYNFEGQRKGKFCARHKVQGMVPTYADRRCEHAGCGTQSSFNYEGEARSRFCGRHKLEGMAHLRGCAGPGCARMPSFNRPGERGARFCAAHRGEGMVDVRRHRPGFVCAAPGCGQKALFNFGNEGFRKFCGRHKVAGMVNLQDKLCEREGCNTRPSFNYESERGYRFCAQHKLEGMVNTASAAFRKRKRERTVMDTPASVDISM